VTNHDAVYPDCIILGGGLHARQLAQFYRDAGGRVVAIIGPPDFVDYFKDIEWLGEDDEIVTVAAKNPKLKFLLGVGSSGKSLARKNLISRLVQIGVLPQGFIHPSAIISPHCHIHPTAQIFPGAIVNHGVSIQENVLVNSGAIIEHDSVLGAATHVAPGAVLCGNVTIGAGCHVGAKSVILEGLSVGDETLIGAGSVVTKNIPANKVAFGVPALEK